MTSVALRKWAASLDERADHLPALDPKAEKLRALARDARVRASLREHGEESDWAIVKSSPLLPGVAQVRRGRGARAEQ